MLTLVARLPKDDFGERLLISDFSVRSGRLLGKGKKDQYDVRIQADVTLKVLRVFDGNMGLIGG
jgi:hypothetical protein